MAEKNSQCPAESTSRSSQRPWYFHVDRDRKIYFLRDGSVSPSGREFGPIRTVTTNDRGLLVVSISSMTITDVYISINT
jgi:hypothetical protein